MRPTITDTPTVQFGEKLETGTTALKGEQKEKNRNVRRAQRLVLEAGMNVQVGIENAGDAEDAAKLLREAYSDENP